MTLRFPHRNAQIKVHKAVVNACSDFFVKAESDGLIENDQMDMLAKDTIGTFSLTGRAYVLYQLIACLKEINRYYKDISLPPFEEVKSILDKTIKK